MIRPEMVRLISAARKVWRYSQTRRDVLKKAEFESGWYICTKCKRETEKPHVDHIVPLGKQPQTFLQFGIWLVKLFCGSNNLQVLCTKCHKEKTKRERKKK